MSFETLIHMDGDTSIKQFWKALDIWLHNPHYVNRRIMASTEILTASTKSDSPVAISTWIEKLDNTLKHFQSHLNDNSQYEGVHASEIAEQYGDLCEKFDVTDHCDKKTYAFLRKLLPRNSEKFSPTVELAVIDKDANVVTFFCKRIVPDKQPLSYMRPYRIEYTENRRVSMSVQESEKVETDPSVNWLKEQLFPRLMKWMGVDSMNNGIVAGSLNLVSTEKYAALYNELKKKYGTEMVRIWPENTDPAKFVYEDVAIATYLLLLWEKERELKELEKKQSFLDLGCGNGLLVHILASEGHSGLGLDLRKRKIWDLYPESTHLEVRTILPSASSLFPETDWLIGNHSDELTPWIPVIAARSSYNCRFFLLPCCAYEFDGRKYQRDSASRSQYFEYMNYVKNICEKCGFETKMDRLRIPSTKRICLIGWERTYPRENSETQDKLIQEIINMRSGQVKSQITNDAVESEGSQWSLNFKPRETVEKVKNCTRLDKSLITDIVNIVTTHLLSKVRVISIDRTPNQKWNAGGQSELSEIVKLIPLEMLKQLKSECGGLQTLLKNNSNIFQVAQGIVQFRIPGAERVNRNKKKHNSKITTKVKPCWFHENHPNGCPVAAEECNFLH